MGILIFPTAVAVVACLAAYLWGGLAALFTVALLAVLETTLSFDNAVVNAKVLERMEPIWQRRFLTWGILVAVFGTRFVLPIFIVAVAAGLAPLAVLDLALFEPLRYGHYLEEAHTAIAAFGAAFLLLVSLKYFFNDRKTVHWLVIVEKHLSRWGGIEAIEVALTLSILLVSALVLPSEAATILIAGLVGVVLFIVIEGVAQSFEMHSGADIAKSSIALFIYLNILDAAFSLDGVVGAFAVTSNLVFIIAGLGVGALFVRSATVALVRARTLETLPYLEHGAHWAIFGLAVALLGSLFIHVPEPFTGLIGLGFIILAYVSSRRAMLKL
ncbi:hypothetical protein A3C21_01945 [Candidatus Kaiserbacteria bacterium RIFCSPHIGHO2_02_FULL_59_21]|uniref:Integral membrane protein n=2 Tax=Candidatus Kaiseribacteriota TaxID=1752734 RepID=A0A0G1YX00_9BACT|nr:MAG: hypothetical protein UY98_C0006G0003 [Candidatus Kaiserbacteria bacterium GW2011_GWA2_58_9]OGG62315.1 MAG: hypothetical protein A2766_01125 [Candidatus Kaiserbacteria bacterium RIFCSPHIGHO2_01_FULL_58_22]OGG67115.1 MAG: hypothetical protein A3C21_01945 [Candidatus Kaiserbacteria bacterium RIFCSPHIGHO2_02_FULL_59_21]OGG78943.1 MAG: hypothetical protein A2952_03770 [Candidatus Kaiserbacteria bacterium RIFCSPLOWO2_01_FULL_59_34]OGG85677.1 MAG: hypothetical protein A3I47_00385 [Candidatus K